MLALERFTELSLPCSQLFVGHAERIVRSAQPPACSCCDRKYEEIEQEERAHEGEVELHDRVIDCSLGRPVVLVELHHELRSAGQPQVRGEHRRCKPALESVFGIGQIRYLAMRAVFRGCEVVGRVESFADEPRLVREDDSAVWAPDLQPLDARAENRCQSCSDPDRHHPRHRFLRVDAVEDRNEEGVRNEDRMELGIVLVVGLHLTSNHRVRSDPDR